MGMLDLETQNLDSEILAFIKKFSATPTSEKLFQSLALKIFGYQFERNENYRKFCLSEGRRPASVASWKEIPAMPTIGFKELVLATFPIKNAAKVFKTSGTTGSAAPATGVRHKAPPGSSTMPADGFANALWRTSVDAPPRGAHFFDTLTLYEAAILPPFKAHLMPATEPSAGFQPDTQDFSFFFLISSPQEAPDSSLSYMMGVVNKVFASQKGKFYVEKGMMKNEALLGDLYRIRKKVFILSTAFSLKSFLDFLRSKKRSLKLPQGSRLMETGGFKGRAREISKPRFYAECKKRLGIDKNFCVSEYGMTELSSQFYDTTLSDKLLKIKRKPFKEGPSWIRTLVIDPRSGREAKKGHAGLLRHFDLANRGSVLAVQTEDIGRAVGDGFELLGRASGSELRGCSLNYEEFLNS